MVKVLAASSNSDSLGNKFRDKRFIFFKNAIKDFATPIRIIDIGGTEKFWINRNFHNNKNYDITLVNLKTLEVKSNNIKSIVGDATNLIQYKDRSFDIVFSNSVIEHVYSFENQERMAREILRLGKYHFVQTPNKYFFIEPHFIFPFFQFLPFSIQLFLLTKTKLCRGRKWQKDFSLQYIKEIRLISKTEMKKLFPNSKLSFEKFYLMNKSFTAHNFN